MPEDKDKSKDDDKNGIPKPILRKLKQLEKRMRAELGTWERTREFVEKIEVIYAVKLMETYFSADLGEEGNVRDLAIRHRILDKLGEVYRMS
ncbi:MAG: hypothetical protein ACXVDE_07180 [Tumebacillaceae bacterium]